MPDPNKLTAKQERFAILVAEGETQSKAYTLAGYAVNNPRIIESNASRLASSAKVKKFIEGIKGKAAIRAGITLESLTVDLMDIRDKALTAQAFGPAVSAVIAIAKLNGFMIDRSELSVVHKPAPLPTKVIELSEQDWIRQFGQGLQEDRIKRLERISRR